MSPRRATGMDNNMRTTLTLVALAAIATGASAINLTGASIYGTTNDVPRGIEEWLATGNAPTWNMYLQVNSQFIQTGNGAAADLSVPLKMGENTFTIYADGASAPEY